ncbi:MAG: hypothetical protein L0Z70_10270 [Chloroflexi bacterium]|nr:hypothetical protein [Chloroflexota bacterium]
MKIRPFDWRDLPALQRSRGQSVFLHASLLLTRGPLVVSGALLSTLAPSMGVYTSVGAAEDGKGESTLIGQIIHLSGAQAAQLTFLAPHPALESSALPALLDHLASQAVERGAFRLLADVDGDTLAYEALRRAGFAIYGRQRIWQVKGASDALPPASPWRAAGEQDLPAVRSLYNNVVPGLVQQVEPLPAERLRGLVYREGDDLLGFVELKYGHRGVWAQPFIHPDTEDVGERLADMLSSLPGRFGRPLFLCVRSYQSWLEPGIEKLGAEPSPRQAAMVKHMAIPQKAVRAFALPALEGGRPEVSAPFARAKSLAEPPQAKASDVYVATTHNR